jgi:hypothetical protein
MLLNKTYRTMNYGSVASFSGQQIIRRDGKLILLEGFGPSGDAHTITQMGGVKETLVKTIKDVSIFPCNHAFRYGWRAKATVLLEDGRTTTIQSRSGHDGGEISSTMAGALSHILPEDVLVGSYEFDGVGFIVK